MNSSNPTLDGKMGLKTIAACVCMVIAIIAAAYFEFNVEALSLSARIWSLSLAVSFGAVSSALVKHRRF